MRFYPDIPRSRAAATFGDLVVLVLLARTEGPDAVADLASAPRAAGDTGGAIQRGFDGAADAVGGPLSGAPRDAGAGAGGQIRETATSGEQDVIRLANLLGLLVFLLPAVAVLARQVPERITDARRLTAAALDDAGLRPPRR